MHPVADQAFPAFEEIGVRGGPGAEEGHIVFHPISGLKGHENGGWQALHEYILSTLFLEPE